MLATAHLKEQRVATIDLSAIHAIREYHPEDLTITVEAGMRLSSLKAELAQHGQWLPLDPPPVEDWTLGRLIDMNPLRASPDGPGRPEGLRGGAGVCSSQWPADSNGRSSR